MHISKLRIKNYKSFVDSGEVIIDENLFAFIGQNNTGKSAIMDAIQCVFPSSKKNVTSIDFHKNTKDDIEIQLWFSEINEEYLEEKIYRTKINRQISKINDLESELEKDFKEITEKKLKDEKKKIDKMRKENYESCIEKYKIKNGVLYIKFIAKKGANISKKYFVDEDIQINESDLKVVLPDLKVIPAIRDPKNESTAGSNSYLKELIQMLDDEMQTNIEIQGNNITYKELNDVIANETKKRCEKLSGEITKFYNGAIGTEDYQVIIDSDVNISKGTSYITKIIDKNTNVESDILNCGTGYQSMIILSILETYVKISKKSSYYILIIEEPEVYLHPKLQRKMIDTLISISKSNQVIFTSHSPITVSKLSKDQIRLIKKIKGDAYVMNIEPLTVIEELGIKADDILSNKGIIFVEGKDDKQVFNILLEKIESGLSNKINVIDVGNCDNLKFYSNAEILINNKFEIPTLIIRDTDTMNPDKRKMELLNSIEKVRNDKLDDNIKEKINNGIIILKRYSLEGYFIDSNLLDCLIGKSKDLESAIRCYECQYDFYCKKVYEGDESKQILSSWYQPKYFLEKFLDKFKLSQNDLIESYNSNYEERWRSFEKCALCEEGNIDKYINIRSKINNETKILKLSRNDFLIESIKDKSIEEIKETKLLEIVEVLEYFNLRINK